MNVVSLFAGIGGFEQAFSSTQDRTILCCEIDPAAQSVLRKRFPNTPLIGDVQTIRLLPPETDILCAGFPCQDLSSIGEKQGLSGTRSSLVREVFRLLRATPVEWVVFENVPYMLKLNRGEAIRLIVNTLEELGYRWAYRIIDSISFVPQKRCRVFVVASRHNDPNDVLLSDDAGDSGSGISLKKISTPIGFYWTEGRYALGLMRNAIPTLKAGSTIGIPSPPAILLPSGIIVTPDIRDAERFQGFPADWTLPATNSSRESVRWRLVGNAVTVNTVAWIAKKIHAPTVYDHQSDGDWKTNYWPDAAWGANGIRRVANVSHCPAKRRRTDLIRFLKYPYKLLSEKATKGFLDRVLAGHTKTPVGFTDLINIHLHQMERRHA